MRSLGIAIKKGELWYAIIDGESKNSSSIFISGKQLFRAESNETDLMMDFFNLFEELLTKYNPDRVAYKIHLNSELKQIPYMHFSLGILNYSCKLKNIPTTSRSTSWISASKNKKTNECKAYFNNDKLKNEELAAILVAWYEIEG